MNWKQKLILAKIETTYGVDPVPTGATNAILATNASIAPMEGQDVNRNLERPYFGSSRSVPVGLYATLSFDVELQGSGAAGTAPTWGPLLRACGVAQTINAGVSTVYNPITASPESVALHFHIDSDRHVLLGSRGTCTFALNAQNLPYIKFVFTGLFSQPSAQAMPTPTYIAPEPGVATSVNTPTFTIGGTAMILRSFELMLNGKIEPRMLIGSETIRLIDRMETAKAQVEAVALATYNPWTTATAGTIKAISLVHGTVAGKIATLSLPYCTQRRLTGFAIEQDIAEWPLEFDVNPSAGNDQWSLTLT